MIDTVDIARYANDSTSYSIGKKRCDVKINTEAATQGVLKKIWCIFSEHLLLGIPLSGCFCKYKLHSSNFLNGSMKFV